MSNRPDRTTMQGMIWNAHKVLTDAASPETNGVPKSLFESAKGVIVISVVEAGFIFSGNVGTGILLAKTKEGWSPPCAVGLTGVGWGFLFGAAVKEMMIFIMDYDTLDSATGDVGIRFGGQVNLTIGPLGRNADVAVNASGKGLGGTVSVAFSKGAFIGLSVEGSAFGIRHAANAAFYGSTVSPKDILAGKVTVPSGDHLLPEVVALLDTLEQGKTKKLSAEDVAKLEKAKAEADQVAASANTAEDVIYVDAEEEAKTEGATQE